MNAPTIQNFFSHGSYILLLNFLWLNNAAADPVEDSRKAFAECLEHIKTENKNNRDVADYTVRVEEYCLREEKMTSAELFHGIASVDSNFQSYRPSYFGYRLSHSDENNEDEIKFQLSLKYQLVEDVKTDINIVNAVSSNWFFGYTQKSFWSIQESSEPFRESNFSPELFKEYTREDWSQDKALKSIRFGFIQHESTGESGTGSQGWNISYIEPIFKFGKLSVAPKIWVPALFQSKTDMAPDNPDIFDFYGHGEIKVYYVQTKRLSHSLMYRQGDNSDLYGFRWQTDYSARLLDWTPKVFIQYWSGYGESLKDYNNKTTGLIVGLSAVH